MKYLLIYENRCNPYEPETNFNLFDTPSNMDEFVNKHVADWGEAFKVIYSCWVHEVFEYKPVEWVTKMERQRSK